MLDVKENEKKPSYIAQRTHYQQITHKSPISSTVIPIYRRGEPKKTKAFTPYALCHNYLRHTGEGVKAKNENRLTRARVRVHYNRRVANGCYAAPSNNNGQQNRPKSHMRISPQALTM